MKRKLVQISASQNEITLYCLMGEALCRIQHLEGALSATITLKLNSDASKQVADEFLNKQRRYTLGTAIQLSAKDNIFVPPLKDELNDFLQHRNWLVHNAMFDCMNEPGNESTKQKLFDRIENISNTARTLQHEIELDLVKFCESKGRDMSKARAVINAQYSEGE